MSSTDFASPAARSAFSLAVKESVTLSTSESIYPITFISVQDAVDAATSVPYVEVTFEQSSTVHSLGVREIATAITLLRTRLLSSCSAGNFEAILNKMGEKLQSSVLRDVRFLGVLLSGSRFTEIPRTTQPSAEPSAAAPSPAEEDGSSSGESGGATLVPFIIVGGALLVAIFILRQVCLCFRKSGEVSPRQRRMAVSNIQVLPS